MSSSLTTGLGQDDRPAGYSPWRRFWADFWIQHFLMWVLATCPRAIRPFRRLGLAIAWRNSIFLRENTLANARFILGPESTQAQRIVLARRIIANHFEFLYDFGRMRKWPLERLQGVIEAIEGESHYHEARRMARGLIIVTAHVGSFEVGLAGLRKFEENIHVVFKRNPHALFEKLRTDQRRRIGIHEAAVDDGLEMWMRLRFALNNGEVVLMQCDRVMPQTRGLEVPFFGGIIELPVGPAKLAAACGVPILPVLAVNTDSRRIRILIKEPIQVAVSDLEPFDPGPTTRRIGAVLEQHIRAYPDQWLAAHSSLIKDRSFQTEASNS